MSHSNEIFIGALFLIPLIMILVPVLMQPPDLPYRSEGWFKSDEDEKQFYILIGLALIMAIWGLTLIIKGIL